MKVALSILKIPELLIEIESVVIVQLEGDVGFFFVFFCRIRRRVWCVKVCRVPIVSRCYTGARMETPLIVHLKSSTLFYQECLHYYFF